MSIASEGEGVYSMSSVSPQYVGLGSDNRWYMFTSGSVRTVYNNVLLGTTIAGGVGTLLKGKLQANAPVWQKAGESRSSSCCAVWTAESQAETLAWSCQVPLLHELGKEWQVLRACADIGNVTHEFLANCCFMMAYANALCSSECRISFMHGKCHLKHTIL